MELRNHVRKFKPKDPKVKRASSERKLQGKVRLDKIETSREKEHQQAGGKTVEKGTGEGVREVE